MASDPYALEALPLDRAAALLRSARLDAGLSRRAAARRVGVTSRTLRRWESGLAAPLPSVIPDLLSAYGVAPERLVPERESLDILPLTDGEDPDAALGRFVDLVRTLRQTPSEPLRCRTADLEDLAEALALDATDVEERIVRLTGCSPEEAATLHRELIRRRLLVPVAGMAIGAASLVGVAMAAQSDTPAADSVEGEPIAAVVDTTTTHPTPAPTPTTDPPVVTTTAPRPEPTSSVYVFTPGDGDDAEPTDTPPAASSIAAVADPADLPPDADLVEPPYDVFVPEGEVFVESPPPSP